MLLKCQDGKRSEDSPLSSLFPGDFSKLVAKLVRTYLEGVYCAMIHEVRRTLQSSGCNQTVAPSELPLSPSSFPKHAWVRMVLLFLNSRFS